MVDPNGQYNISNIQYRNATSKTHDLQSDKNLIEIPFLNACKITIILGSENSNLILIVRNAFQAKQSIEINHRLERKNKGKGKFFLVFERKKNCGGTYRRFFNENKPRCR